MYLFTRSGRLARGQIREAIAWTGEVTEKVNQISDLPVSLWQTVMSPDVGRMTWSTMTDELEALQAIEDKLLADNSYVDLVDRGAAFTTGDLQDQLATIVHAPADIAERQAGYVTVVTAQATNGQFGRAVEVAIQIAQKATALSGVDTSVALANTGPYAQLAWITGAADLAELQRSEQAINSDPGFVAFLDDAAGDVYVPGSGQQTISRRIV
jgi:hypothetical protein